jgi:hypothetical protein
MAGGRPLKFGSPEEILNAGMVYFERCKGEGRPLTITGLCIELGTYRDVLMDYQDDRGPEFSNAVKTLKTFCENYAEEQVFIGRNCAGAIFALKNYGWRDKSDHALTDGEGKPLNTAPQLSIINFDTYLQQKNAKSGPQNLVEGFQRSPLDETDKGAASAQ